MTVFRLLIIGVFFVGISAAASYGQNTARSKVNGKVVPYSVWHEKVLPGKTMTLSLPIGYSAELNGTVVNDIWVAPDIAGNHTLEIKDQTGVKKHALTIFVMEPMSNTDDRGYLNGYRIGTYPRNPPKGLIKLEKGDRDLSVSPHFKIGQFLCKQQPGHWPKYLYVTKSNLKRLEALLINLNKDEKTDAQTLFVMSGFRTPFYNTAIGSAKFSRHMYGDAADVYIDVKPRDGNMDDINEDGEITKADANYLYDYAEDLFADLDTVQPGGLGSYKANAVHGPFVHVDGRGRPARWGR